MGPTKTAGPILLSYIVRQLENSLSMLFKRAAFSIAVSSITEIILYEKYHVRFINRNLCYGVTRSESLPLKGKGDRVSGG